MALPAVDLGMLANQRQSGFVVVKRVNIFIKMPSFWTMTSIATDLKISTVRGIGLLI